NMTDYVPMEGSIDEDTYIVGPGDQFLVGFVGSVEEKYFVPVGADGFVILPYSTSVKVSDMSLAKAKERITEGLSQIYNERDFSVTLVSARLFVVHVTGMVSMPGSYVLTAADRINAAIEMAGGPLLSARLSNTKLIRGGDTLDIDLNRYKADGDLNSNPHLLDGDVVHLTGFEPGSPWVYLSGASFTDGTVNFNRGETISQIISRLGANRDRIDFGSIHLIRGGESYNVDLLNTTDDVALSQGDSIFLSLLADSVYIGGRVTAGGAVKYVGGLSPRAYVAMAGGIAKEGTMGKIKIYRNGEKLSERKAGHIRPGDAIIVGTDNFYLIVETARALGQIATLASTIYVIGFRD
ncbi:MAG TPA: polysaccharide export protein, partial [candidate division Zixibacteria bacterium]|nr:polysaccharide export protein [candidate division Zixibacteria bacterium]